MKNKDRSTILYLKQCKCNRLILLCHITKIDLAVIVLSAPNNQLETLKPLVPRIKEVIASIQIGEIVYVYGLRQLFRLDAV